MTTPRAAARAPISSGGCRGSARPTTISLVLVVLLVVFAARLLHTGWSTSLTIDEPQYVAKGTYLWSSNDYAGFDTLLLQPPLAYHLASLPFPLVEPDGFEPGRNAGRHLFRDAATPLRDVRMASRVPFMLLACWGAWLVYAWARAIAGPAAGLLGAFLFTFCPAVLGYGPLAHSDLLVSVFFLQTLYTAWQWWRSPTSTRAALTGLSFGLALASKLSAVLLLPTLAAVATLAVVRPVAPGVVGEPRARVRSAMSATLVVGLAALAVLWLAYGGSLRSQPTAVGPFEVPLPELVRVVLLGRTLALEPRQLWFFGSLLMQPAWYVLPVAFATKTPVATLVLGAWALARRASPQVRAARLGVFVGLTIAVYLAVACLYMNSQQGLRYLLPVLPLVHVLIAVRATPSRRAWERVLVAICATSLALASLLAHPHYIAYFNALVGGSSRGHAYFADSNLDWGQDLPTLAAWLAERGNPQIHTALFVAERPRAYGIRALPLVGCGRPEGGLVAISVAVLRGMYRPDNYFVRPPAHCYDWLEGLEPVATPGHTIFVYDLGAS